MTDKMNTKLTKDDFIATMGKRIQMRNTLIDFYKYSYLPTLKKFDGKIYNVRFIKALREEAGKVNKLIYVKEMENNSIEIQLRASQFSYNDYESIYVRCITTEHRRLSYDDTINDKTNKAWIENFNKNTQEHYDAIEHYDKYMEKANELVRVLNEYNKLPHIFRSNLDTNWMRIY